MELIPVEGVKGVIAFKPEDVDRVIVGLSVQSARQYIDLMRKDPEFTDGVIKPTQRTTIVILNRFLEFMRKMDDNKFR